MTPFDSWYAANVEPNLPKDFPPQLAKAGKAEAAKVWNAALDETVKQLADCPIERFLEMIDKSRARVSP